MKDRLSSQARTVWPPSPSGERRRMCGRGDSRLRGNDERRHSAAYVQQSEFPPSRE